jgi:hypothetical protein
MFVLHVPTRYKLIPICIKLLYVEPCKSEDRFSLAESMLD